MFFASGPSYCSVFTRFIYFFIPVSGLLWTFWQDANVQSVQSKLISWPAVWGCWCCWKLLDILWNRSIKQQCPLPKQCSWFCLYTGYKSSKNTAISRSFKPSVRPFEKKPNHGTSSTDRLGSLTCSSTCWEKEPCINQAFTIYQPKTNRESRAQAS